MPLLAYRQSVCVNLFNPGESVCGGANQPRIRGRRAGVIGTGVATGRRLYSGLGLFGLAFHYAMRSGIFSYQNCRRRLFIMVRTERYSPPGRRAAELPPDADCRPVDNFLSPGINDRFIQSTKPLFLSVFFRNA